MEILALLAGNKIFIQILQSQSKYHHAVTKN